MIRGDLIRQIGLLDEDFFFYGEDIEFSHRVLKAGYRRYYQATAGSITHLGGGSSSPDEQPSLEKTTRQYRAQYLVQRKCYGVVAKLFLQTLDHVLWSSKLILRKWMRGSQDPSYIEARKICAILRGSL
jgi:GT2 family glycosyltransferase